MDGTEGAGIVGDVLLGLILWSACDTFNDMVGRLGVGLGRGRC